MVSKDKHKISTKLIEIQTVKSVWNRLAFFFCCPNFLQFNRFSKDKYSHIEINNPIKY